MKIKHLQSLITLGVLLTLILTPMTASAQAEISHSGCGRDAPRYA